MKTYHKFFTIAALIASLSACYCCAENTLTSAQNKLFQDGNNFYGESKWTEAIDSYSQLLQHGESPTIHFNIANAYAQLNKIGYARFHFEKALKLNPQFKQAKENLASIIHIENNSLFAKIFSFATFKTWLYIISASFWLTAIFVAMLAFKLYNKKRVLILTTTSTFLTITASIILIANLNKLSQAVILVTTQVKFAPTEQSPARDTLNEGSICQIIDKNNNFTYISVKEKNLEGWIPSSTIGII